MIAALLAVFLLLFMSEGLAPQLANIDDKAKEHVPDKARREMIIDTSKALDEGLKAVVKSLDKHFEELTDVNANYASTEADYDAVRDKLQADQAAATKAILDARDIMHEQMTREEWAMVFAPEETNK